MTGIEIKAKLGLADYPFVYIQTLINCPFPVYIVSYSSRNKGVALPLKKLRQTQAGQPLKIKKGIEVVEYKLSPKISIENFMTTFPSRAIIIKRDLAGDLISNPSLVFEKKGQEITDRSRQFFKEFTIVDFRNYYSGLTKKYRRIRDQVKGQEGKLLSLLDYDWDNHKAIFGTEPTYGFMNPTFPRGAVSAIPGSFYEVEVQLVDLDKWVDNWQTLSNSQFKEILEIIDLKLSCSCSSYLFQGHRYQLTQLDASVYPLNISDPIWGPRHDGKGGLCKHLLGTVRSLQFQSGAILNKIRQEAKKRGMPWKRKRKKKSTNKTSL